MAMTDAEREALRKVKVSGVNRVTVSPDSVTTEFRSLADIERIESSDTLSIATTEGRQRVRRVAFGISSGIE
jgi:hypothetical protein